MHKSWLGQKLHKYGKGHESAWKGWDKRWGLSCSGHLEQADVGETRGENVEENLQDLQGRIEPAGYTAGDTRTKARPTCQA